MAATAWSLSAAAPPLAHPAAATARALVCTGQQGRLTSCSSVVGGRVVISLLRPSPVGRWDQKRRPWSCVVCMAPEEEKRTRRSPLDFPIEWEWPKPARRPDIFPKFSPMKTPLPPPLPADPPEEDEDYEEKKEEEEDPEKEEEDDPDKPQSMMQQGV